MADNTELTEELLDYEEDEQQAPAADDNAAGDVKKPKGLSCLKHLMQIRSYNQTYFMCLMTQPIVILA